MTFRSLIPAVLLAAAALSHPRPAFPEVWSIAGSLAHARGNHTATLLADGRVLVAGGSPAHAPYPFDTAEVFDPSSATWSEVAKLGMSRAKHTATLLHDGRVLVAGGAAFRDLPWETAATASGEIYDPATGKWNPTASMSRPRSGHTATALADGTVLVVGGVDFESIDTAELYDPVTDSWRPAGVLSAPRVHHSATLLADGSVLVAGGTDDGYLEHAVLGATELYDSAANTWKRGPPLTVASAFHAATVTPAGQVLVTGGYDWPHFVHSRVEAFDPDARVWSNGDGLAHPRSGHTATLLPSGEILVAGGARSGETESESFSFESGKWRATGRLNYARRAHTATLLLDGRLLVAGGFGLARQAAGTGAPEVELASSEIYGELREIDACKNHYILSRPCPAPN